MRAVVGHSLPCTQNWIHQLSVPVGGLFPDMAHGHHPIDGAKTTFPFQSMMEFGFNFGSESGSSGFNLDFNSFDRDFDAFDFTNSDNFDFGLGNMDVDGSATFDYKHAFMEAAVSAMGVQENASASDNFPANSSQLASPPYPSHPNVDTMSSIGTSTGLSSPVPSSTSGSGGLSAPTLPVPDDHPNVDTMSSIYTSTGLSSPVPSSPGGLSAPTLPLIPVPDHPDDILARHHRPTKRKKVDEVNTAHILPEGIQRSRTRSAKAVAALESLEFTTT
jgi:hypothetical protein